MADVDYRKLLRENLKQYRDRLGITQEQCAAKIGMGIRQFQEVERGAANPTLESLTRISSSLSLTLDRLLRLDFLRLQVLFTDFVKRCDSEFEGIKYGMGIRTLEGVTVMGKSPNLGEYWKSVVVGKSLFDYLPESEHLLMRAQLECEKIGFPCPTLLQVKRDDGNTIIRRVYPTLIYEGKMKTPSHAAVFSVAPEEDCQENYLDFVERLLLCAG